MTVIAIAGDNLVALLKGHLHPDNDRFLANIEMAETADRAHAVKLARLFLEATDQHHVAKGMKFLVLGESQVGGVAGAITSVLRGGAFLR